MRPLKGVVRDGAGSCEEEDEDDGVSRLAAGTGLPPPPPAPLAAWPLVGI